MSLWLYCANFAVSVWSNLLYFRFSAGISAQRPYWSPVSSQGQLNLNWNIFSTKCFLFVKACPKMISYSRRSNGWIWISKKGISSFDDSWWMRRIWARNVSWSYKTSLQFHFFMAFSLKRTIYLPFHREITKIYGGEHARLSTGAKKK